MYSPQNDTPKTFAEAVIYATYWYADSGWTAFLSGWCFGNGMTYDQMANAKRPGRQKLIQWADKEIRK